MTKKILTHDHLKKILHYCPETGFFTWKVSFDNSVKIGDRAGTVQKNQNGKRYIKILFKGRIYSAHRLAWLYMTGCYPVDQIDHDDGNGLNNKWLNFKDVSNKENHRNMKKFSNNTSGCTGVSWNKKRLKWHAHITVSYKLLFLGYFIDYFEAICARKSAESKHGFHLNHGSIRSL